MKLWNFDDFALRLFLYAHLSNRRYHFKDWRTFPPTEFREVVE